MTIRIPSVSAGLRALACGLLLLAGGGCQKQDDPAPEVVLAWRAEPHPPRVGPGRILFTLTDRTTGEPVAGAEVRLEGNMSHPGMQPVLATAAEVAPGKYEAPLAFTMAGDWFILFEGTLADGRPLHRQVDVAGVRAP